MLLEFGNNAEKNEEFSKALKNAVGHDRAVESRTPKVTPEIRDMDSLSTGGEEGH